MKFSSILLFCLVWFSATYAQNWQTVKPAALNYFSAGRHTSYGGHYISGTKPYPGVPDTSLLRVIRVSDVTISGPDTLYTFFKSTRDSFFIRIGTANYTGCIDTAAPSWLGTSFLRRAGGVECYFNSKGDTITVNTQATLNQSWVLAQDTSGKSFIATVSQLGTINVDGTSDSFKTITIQAYNGTAAIPHPYNNKILKLSKNHGWLSTLDFYRFPNLIWGRDRNGIAIDSTQHTRIPIAFQSGGGVNMVWKYKPGNEWIVKDDYGFNDVTNFPDSSTTVHDSILTYQSLGVNTALVTIRSIIYKEHHYPINQPPGGFANWSRLDTVVHTDTVSNNSISWNPGPEIGYMNAIYSRYFVQQFDTGHWFLTRSDLYPYGIFNVQGCQRLGPTVSAPDDQSRFETYLSEFGTSAVFVMECFSGLWCKERYWRYLYIKIGSSTYGTKVNISKLEIASPKTLANIIITPVPANHHIRISNLPVGQTKVSLATIMGQTLREFYVRVSDCLIPTDDLPDGLYFLEVSGSDFRKTSRIIIHH